MMRIAFPIIVILAVVLSVLGGRAISAQDYTVQGESDSPRPFVPANP
jgi:hypothetical protein